MPTLRQLEVFSMAGSVRNLRAAAEELRVAQSSISVQLRLLEKEFGTKLYTTSSRGIDLTPTGAMLLAESDHVLADLKNLKTVMQRRFADSNSTALTIGGTESLSAGCLPRLLAVFQETHASVRFNLRTADGWTLAKMILSGEVDLALLHSGPTHRRLAAEPFGIDGAVLCVSRNHPLAGTRRLTNDALDNFGFVVTKATNGSTKAHLSIDILKRRGLSKLKVVLECDTIRTKLAAVENQIGIGLFFRSTVERELKRGTLVELASPNGELQWRSYIVYDKKKELSPPARDFLGLLRKQRTEMKQKHSPE